MVQVLKEVGLHRSSKDSIWLQWCDYSENTDNSETGYRFIWKDPEGKMQPHRGQARIPNLYLADALISKARLQGWGHELAADAHDWT
ncbi:hypothetical protein GCM10023219_16570 [Stakelama sediminis]|uniref:Uncharacterized protein n=1 Tax=Stakelama sediminis TaxID=463200 RepID=A0A840YXZ5_9SPHN|nr:hypothetical protein [Stakelama sediminis]MBB5718386.1 hypothetical protein [Stakelama sediminis]